MQFTIFHASHYIFDNISEQGYEATYRGINKTKKQKNEN